MENSQYFKSPISLRNKVLILALIGLVGFNIAFQIGNDVDPRHPYVPVNRFANDTLKASDLDEHDAIYIAGNDAMVSTAAAEGWTGNGQSGNPFIIDELLIDTDGADTSGKMVGAGIWLDSVTLFVCIQDCLMVDNDFGIILDKCQNIVVAGNSISLSIQDGVFIKDSSSITVSANTVSDNGGHGVYLLHSTAVTINAGNEISTNQLHGVCLAHGSNGNTVAGNTFVNNRNLAIVEYENAVPNSIGSNTITSLPAATDEVEVYALIAYGPNLNPEQVPFEELCDHYSLKRENVVILPQYTTPQIFETDFPHQLDLLAARVDSNDKVLIFEFAHGCLAGFNELNAYFPLTFDALDESYECIRPWSLESKLDNFTCDEVYLIVDSCFSGSIIDFSESARPWMSEKKSGRFIMTGIQYTQGSSGDLLRGLEDALDDDGRFKRGDINHDGVVLFQEVYEYYMTHRYELNAMDYPLMFDGLSNVAEENPLDCIKPIVCDVSETYSADKKTLDLGFTIEGSGDIASINVQVIDQVSGLQSGSLHAVTPDGPGRYTTQITRGSAIGTYFIQVNYVDGDVEHYYSDPDIECHDPCTDTDDDMISDWDEFTMSPGPNCMDADTDDDLLLDGFEIEYGFDWSNQDSDYDSTIDGNEDSDSDTVFDKNEQLAGSSPLLADTDADGISDADEIVNNMNPAKADTDDDGLADAVEYAVLPSYATLPDRDSDGLKDGTEVKIGSDPNDDQSNTNAVLGNTIQMSYSLPLTITDRPDLTVFPGSGTAEDPFVIEGMIFDNPGYTQLQVSLITRYAWPYPLEWNDLDYIIIRDCIFLNMDNSKHGIELTNIHYVTVQDCAFIRPSGSSSGGMGIRTAGIVNDYLISHCTFKNYCCGIFALGANWRISFNTFENCGLGGMAAIQADTQATSTDYSIIGNSFIGNGNAVYYMILGLGGSTWHVFQNAFRDVSGNWLMVFYELDTHLDDGTLGNYYADYQAQYPSATNDGNTWDTPYRKRILVLNHPGELTADNHPLCDSDCDHVSDGAESLLGLDPYDPDSNVGTIIKDCDQDVFFRTHDVIGIYDDNGFTSASGVVRGSGTQQDPYIIEGLVISSSNWAAILVWSTSAYFVIRQCIIIGQSGMLYGMYLYADQHATVEDCYIQMPGWFGMVISGCNNVEVSNNVFEGGNTAISLSGVCTSTFHDNTFHGQSHYSFQLNTGSNYNLFYENDFLTKYVIVNSGGGSGNQWNTAEYGNYWGDYTSRYPSTTNDGTIWDTPYELQFNPGEFDYKPLVAPGYEI